MDKSQLPTLLLSEVSGFVKFVDFDEENIMKEDEVVILRDPESKF